MELDLVRAVVGFGFLGLAATMDLRTRTVKDEVWVAFGALALAIVELDLAASGAPWFLHLVPAATAVVYFGVFFGEPMWDEDGVHWRPARLLLYGAVPIALLLAGTMSAADADVMGAFWRLLTMAAMILVAHGMYYTNLLRGGGDAKAAMALGLLFPGVYPHLGPFPLLAASPFAEPILAVWFPFAFIAVVDAALLFLPGPLFFLARNAASGTAKLPRAFFGYAVPIDQVPKHAWLLDRVEDGQVVHTNVPRRADDEEKDREEQLRLLRERGATTVWVTPKLPFVTAILAGYALAVAVGNPLLALFGGLGR